MSEDLRSELPLLLFQVDTTPQTSRKHDNSYESVYYFPDLDTAIFLRLNNRETFLDGTVDLRELFVNFGMPQRRWPEGAKSAIVSEAIDVLKAKIDEISSSNEICSWKELGQHLEQMKAAKKVLK